MRCSLNVQPEQNNGLAGTILDSSLPQFNPSSRHVEEEAFSPIRGQEWNGETLADLRQTPRGVINSVLLHPHEAFRLSLAKVHFRHDLSSIDAELYLTVWDQQVSIEGLGSIGECWNFLHR
jgi:hypothetical protein